ncbi:MAG: NAD(P)-binding domain-containing protein [Ktedonobacterales bacterium]|nr:NAD(P)-binding domain-containing protein [Ktedonobacterales bacterium]
MATLRIAVLGAGNIGGTLGRKWTKAGHTVAYGVRDPQNAEAQTLRQSGASVTVGTVADALGTDPQVILFAIPGGTMEATIATHAAQINGRTVIDAANRLGGGGPTDSFANFQQQTPTAQVYRAFNTLGWENFENPVFNGMQGDLFFAGPEGDSLAQVEQLISDVGLRPIRLGGTDQIGAVDALLGVWFTLSKTLGRHLAFKVLSDASN